MRVGTAALDPAVASAVKPRVEPVAVRARAALAEPAARSAKRGERTADMAAPVARQAERVVRALVAAAPALPGQAETAADKSAPSKRSVAGRRNARAA